MNFRIATSKIHGNGVIANKDFAKGETIGVAILIFSSMEAFAPVISPVITEMGRHVNHSYNPNSKLRLIEAIPESRYDLIATKDIFSGEEIVANYNEAPGFLERAKPNYI